MFCPKNVLTHVKKDAILRSSHKWYEGGEHMINRHKLLGKMAEAGISQKGLAQLLRVSENTVGSRINGRSPFNTVEIEAICRALNITAAAEKVEIFLPTSSQNRDYPRC